MSHATLAKPAGRKQTNAAFLKALEAVNAQPLWDRLGAIISTEPRPPDSPMQWRWADMEPLVQRAVDMVGMQDAERRVLMLTNPAFGGKAVTTTNLFAGLQILEPGEKARPHRHTVAALRVVMVAPPSGMVTLVNGKRCEMHPGDLILTPAWTWHEHVNEGKSRGIWFDGLDLPLCGHLQTIFLEHPASGAAMPATVPDNALSTVGLAPDLGEWNEAYSPLFHYGYDKTKALLKTVAPAADGARRLRYVNPLDGGPVMPTVDCYILRLKPGRATARFRTTHNTVCLVLEGSGQSSVGEKTFRWTQHDVFTVPHWNWVSHRADGGPACLFLFTDRELLRRMGYLREETGTAKSSRTST
jgi:gentisate 1,2-dioxygenase